MDLDRVPLWRGDHVGLKELWNDYSQYLYLPRLRDSSVLLEAVRSGISLLTWNSETFAYAGAFNEETGRYSGLVGGENAPIVLDTMSVLVKPEVASRQIADDRARVAEAAGEKMDERTPPGTVDSGGTESSSLPVEPSKPTRFYGRVSLEPVRLLRDIGDVAEAIVQQLGQTGASVNISVEIEAANPAGFSDDVRRTVSENATTLKFESHEFEKE